ncbi:hypothetical protein GBAR_LOCUS12643, partial [Geodia barretti]
PRGLKEVTPSWWDSGGTHTLRSLREKYILYSSIHLDKVRGTASS